MEMKGKRNMGPNKRRTVLGVIVLVILMGCGGKGFKEGTEMTYNRMLADTDPKTMETVQPGSEKEREAIDRFKSFYQVFSAEIIKDRIRTVYAGPAYFRDGYREVTGLDNIEAYFLKSAETVHECTFDIQDVAVHEGNYYFRWVMNLTTKRWKDEPITAVGMSHVRFDQEGKVIFHQDYWDTSLVYEKIPIVGSVIRWVREQF